ncbi:MAG: NAD(P)-dependent oxidoreductase [Pyrinomonadaceae bacterium]
MNTLVTGGSGYLGTHVRRFFEAEDYSRRSYLDVLNDYDLARIDSYDAVIHLAAHLDKAPQAAETCFRVNAEGTANVARHMRAGAVLIYASTKDVYGSFADGYTEVPESCSTEYAGQSALEWSKLIGERYVEYYAHANNLRSCIFRLSNTYARASEDNQSGFITHYVESIKHGWPIRLPLDGTPVRDILHVDDFARACRAFIESDVEHGLYNLGGGRAHAATLGQLIETIGKVVGREPVIDQENRLPAPVPVNYVSDLTRVREELVWQPQIGIEEGIKTLL